MSSASRNENRNKSNECVSISSKEEMRFKNGAKKMTAVIDEECDENESGIDSKLPSQSYQ